MKLQKKYVPSLSCQNSLMSELFDYFECLEITFCSVYGNLYTVQKDLLNEIKKLNIDGKG